MPYLRNFIKLSKLAGIDLDTILNKEIKIKIAPSQFKGAKSEAIAIALGSENNDRVAIAVNPRHWNTMSDLEKETTMYHELLHDVFNVMHVDNENHIMHPTAQPMDQTDLVSMLVDAISQVKNSELKLFK